jgi:hypothetical protein
MAAHAAFRRLPAALFALMLTACAAEAIRPGAPKVVTGLIIAPHALHEECLKLVPGDRVDYRFTSKMPLAFNIHYHEGKVVVMPVTRDDTVEDAGIFRPTFAQDYCLMWETGPDGAILDYRVALTPGQR